MSGRPVLALSIRQCRAAAASARSDPEGLSPHANLSPMHGALLAGVSALVIALTIFVGPVGLFIGAGLMTLVLFLLAKPSWFVYITILAGLTALPAFIPYSLQLGATTLFVYEPFLFGAALWAVATHPAPLFARSRAFCLAAIVVLGALIGLAHENPPIEIIGDGRGLLATLLAFVVSSRLWGTPYQRIALKVLLVSQWISVAVVLLASILGFPVAGRTEAASLFLSSSGAAASESTRFLTAASQVSVLVLSVTLALIVVGRVTLKQSAAFLIPSAMLTFLGFSRNSFLAVVLAVLFAIAVARTLKPLAVALRISLLAGVPIVALALAHASFGIPGGDYVLAQVNAFTTRVIGGLDASTLNDDTSAIARMNEDAYLVKGIAESPFTGHGFGHAYRPAVGPPGSFSATKGQYYGHNFYLWLSVKTGAIGLFAFLWITLVPTLKTLRRPGNSTLALGSASAGLLLSITFAPFPNDVSNGGSLAVGLILGALCGALAGARDDQTESTSGLAPRVSPRALGTVPLPK